MAHDGQDITMYDADDIIIDDLLVHTGAAVPAVHDLLATAKA